MQYKEITGSLLQAPENYYLVTECSIDLDFSRGLNAELDRIYNLKSNLESKYTRNLHFYKQDIHNIQPSTGVVLGRVICLFTKNKIYECTSLDMIEECLEELSEICNMYKIGHLAIPRLGSIDGLDWGMVKKLLIQHLNLPYPEWVSIYHLSED